MLEFEQLVEERDNIMISFLEGNRVDFSKLRKICKNFNDECAGEKIFECEGTDQQLWESVTTYFQELLKKS